MELWGQPPAGRIIRVVYVVRDGKYRVVTAFGGE